MSKVLRAYMGLDDCRTTCKTTGGMYIREGNYYHKPFAKLYKWGFHACTNPLDVFHYFPLFMHGHYHEVFLINPTDEKGKDSLRCSASVLVGRELDAKRMILKGYERALDKVLFAKQCLEEIGYASLSDIFPGFHFKAEAMTWFYITPNSQNNKVLIDVLDRELQKEKFWRNRYE